MRDLDSPRMLYLKGALMLAVGAIAAGLLLFQTPTLLAALLLAITIWAFCRAYYFAFYVIEHYIDPGYSYAGLLHFFRHHLRRRKGQ